MIAGAEKVQQELAELWLRAVNMPKVSPLVPAMPSAARIAAHFAAVHSAISSGDD
jgi:hypothetical protein